jgi:hypothetical protein
MPLDDRQGLCVFCGEPVRGKCARELSSAWEVDRGAGGANAVRGPGKRYSGRVAHPVCHESALRMERSGLVGQAGLF